MVLLVQALYLPQIVLRAAIAKPTSAGRSCGTGGKSFKIALVAVFLGEMVVFIAYRYYEQHFAERIPHHFVCFKTNTEVP